jgi:fermentation-respiration switch protein FrsA (DUF1100 family)
VPYLLNNENIKEKNINIRGIPCIRLVPKIKGKSFSTIIFYHGWSSTKENQRFRGFILSNLGYQVIIPDAIYHGERNPIDYNSDNAAKHFWRVILNNIEESDTLVEELINKYDANPDNIAVVGHSMGGFTSAGVFTHNKNIKTSVILNGSLNWKMSNTIFLKKLTPDTVEEKNLIEEVELSDPISNLHKLAGRPLLILHGGGDNVVSKVPQQVFYEKIKPLYKDKTKIKMIEYPDLGHFVTTNMLEDGAKWLLKWCSRDGS